MRGASRRWSERSCRIPRPSAVPPIASRACGLLAPARAALRGCVTLRVRARVLAQRGRIGHGQRDRPARAVEAFKGLRSTSTTRGRRAEGGARRSSSAPGCACGGSPSRTEARPPLSLRLRGLRRRQPHLRTRPAFPDLRIGLGARAGGCVLDGSWQRPLEAARSAQERPRDGLMAVRFHLPSKVYEHQNAADGRRARQHRGLAAGRRPRRSRRPLEFGADMDGRSILLLDGDAVRGRRRPRGRCSSRSALGRRAPGPARPRPLAAEPPGPGRIIAVAANGRPFPREVP